MKEKTKFTIGIDEVGRGPLAGPVAVCVLGLTKNFGLHKLKGIHNSKKLSVKQREEWFKKVKKEKDDGFIFYKVSFVGNWFIDDRGISQAIKTALTRSIKKLRLEPKNCKILLDGSLQAPKYFTNQKTIIGGDEKIPVIALASIVAKVLRDRKMIRLAKKYPGYGLEIHKGYGTRAHYKALKNKGLSPIHRKSFLKKLKRP